MDGRAAHQAVNLYATPRYGVTASFNPGLYRVKVTVAPSTDGVNPLTGYMPLSSPWVGNGWGMVCPPGAQDQHTLLFVQSNPDQGFAAGRFYDANHLPPKRADGQDAVYGEFLLVDKSGNRVQLTNDQKILIAAVVEMDQTAAALIAMTTPSVTTSGNLTVGTGASGSFTTPTGNVVTVRDGIITNIA